MNTVRKKRSNKSSNVIKLEKTRQLQYSKFKSKLVFLPTILASFSLIVGGIIYFLVGQVQLTVLNDRLLRKSRILKSDENNKNNLLTKNEKTLDNDNNSNLELNDKVEIF